MNKKINTDTAPIYNRTYAKEACPECEHTKKELNDLQQIFNMFKDRVMLNDITYQNKINQLREEINELKRLYTTENKKNNRRNKGTTM